ncbi:MAG: hypothetical protein AABZ02_07200 [Bacteroidota bacterium]
MIKPDQFYTSDDQPTEAGRKRMWQAIESEIAPHRATFLSIADKRSFAYGMAAAVLLYLSGVGALTVVRQLIENSQPTVVKVDNAYRSAITEFERVVPYVTATTSQSQQMAGELSSRKEQIRLIDAAITELRLQTNENDISPVKRERLRQLYSMKLQILQQMIERGEIEL